MADTASSVKMCGCPPAVWQKAAVMHHLHHDAGTRKINKSVVALVIIRNVTEILLVRSCAAQRLVRAAKPWVPAIFDIKGIGSKR